MVKGEFQVGSRWGEDRTGTQEKGWARITGMSGSHVGAAVERVGVNEDAIASILEVGL